ncbi:MAG: mycofactocin biosynthesis glycosyltransferase MftF [Ilumatobacteraceae bacterium]
MGVTRYRLDPSWRRPGDGSVVVAGSPLRLFRLSAGGAHVVSLVEAGTPPSTAAVDDLLDRFVVAGALHPLPTSSPFTLDDVTVVMPFYAGEGDAGEGDAGDSDDGAVRVPDGLRVIVVDDASPVPPTIPASESDGRVTVIRREVNGGPGAARNTGLAAVTTPLVAFVDRDVTLPEDATAWLDPLLAHFTDDRVALVAPRVANATDTHLPTTDHESRHSPLDLGDVPARIAPGTRVGYVPAATIVCRTEVIRDLGGFDRSMRVGEDVDLVWRLVEAGHRARYEPTSVVAHRPRPSWAALWRQRVAYGSSAAPLARRHATAVAPVRTTVWSLAVWGFVAVRRPLLALSVGAATTVALTRRLDALRARDAAPIALEGHLAAGVQLCRAMRRVWWPIAIIVALCVRRARPVLLGALVVPEVVAAVRERSSQPLVDLPRVAVDDVAYGAGVWRGVFTAHSARALVPEISV